MGFLGDIYFFISAVLGVVCSNCHGQDSSPRPCFPPRRCAGRWRDLQWRAPIDSPEWNIQPREEDELWDPVPEPSEPQLGPPGPETEWPPDRRGRSRPQNRLGPESGGRSLLLGRAKLRLRPQKRPWWLTLPKEILHPPVWKSLQRKQHGPTSHPLPWGLLCLVESEEMGPWYLRSRGSVCLFKCSFVQGSPLLSHLDSEDRTGCRN